MIIINPDRTDVLVGALAMLWEVSVRATHHFLTEEDIDKLLPFVREGLYGIEILVIACEGDRPVAFMGGRGG